MTVSGICKTSLKGWYVPQKGEREREGERERKKVPVDVRKKEMTGEERRKEGEGWRPLCSGDLAQKGEERGGGVGGGGGGGKDEMLLPKKREKRKKGER